MYGLSLQRWFGRKEGVHKSAQQCKVQWEKLTAKFNKFFDNEKNIPSDW